MVGARNWSCWEEILKVGCWMRGTCGLRQVPQPLAPRQRGLVGEVAQSRFILNGLSEALSSISHICNLIWMHTHSHTHTHT